MNGITLGSDPEFMLVKDGEYKSAIGVVQGDVENRIRINGHEFYWDNVMAECAIKPGRSAEDFVNNVRDCLKIYAKMVHPYELVAQASQEYPSAELRTKAAQRAGCHPEISVYEIRKFKPAVKEFKTGCLRCCGGHVHLGNERGVLVDGMHTRWTVVLLLDLFLGIPSLFLDKDPTSARRRSLYGKAGRFRDKDYGVEYRSLSNFWLQSPHTVEFVYEVCNWVVNLVETEGKQWWSFNKEHYYSKDRSKCWTCHRYDAAALRAAIDDSDSEAALPFLDLAMCHLPVSIRKKYECEVDKKPKPLYQEWSL